MAKSKTLEMLISSGGCFNTQDSKIAAAAMRTRGVQHVFSQDLGDGKITHRFMVQVTCNSK